MNAIDFKNDLIIDYEGWQDGDTVLIKELSFVSLRYSIGKTFMFRPDTALNNFSEKFQRHVKFCSRNLSRIPYEYGETSYEVLYELKYLFPLMCQRLVSKGARKCDFLEFFFQNARVRPCFGSSSILQRTK